ncbi:MAG TPA: T9SS type A sorting domain-containing protein [Bacteroidales bacterium]|nr:T9SS type A sorting domain-containing protein [Bacteroidales bacterium]HPR57118.1 T9SS type A sorting domain-containing protein [Bacteroidales bacterium]
MKKTLLLSISICISLLSFTQERMVPASKELVNKSFERKHLQLREPATLIENANFSNINNLKDSRLAGEETEIIETIYDLQTNATVGNRFHIWEDGTMAAVATRGMTTSGWNDRGTGYNYFDGSTWGPKPTARIENVATGWPSLTPWGENGEMVVAHTSFSPYILTIYKRENKGTGQWELVEYSGPGNPVEPTWPRIATTGDNNEIIHLFYSSYNAYEGQDNALLYSRSEDGGVSWFPEDEILPGLGADHYNDIHADSYVLASKNNTVALLYTDAFADMFILKSTDHGVTWDKIMIWEHPYPFFDFNSTLMEDTLYSVDYSGNLAIDDNGMVHVVWGIGRVARLAAAPPSPGSYSYWPYTDGIGYWNESMGQIPEAENVHHTMMPEYLESLGMLIGWTQDVNNSGFIFDYEGTAETPFAVYRSLGISTMPTIAINGNMIALAYASVTETFVTTDATMNYKHIWTRFSYDLGETWGNFTDLQTGDIFHQYDECIYPILAHNTTSDGVFHLIYNADNYPGLFLDDDHEAGINRIIHNKMDFTIGINEPINTENQPLTVSQSYPNPSAGITDMMIEIAKTSNITLELFNLTGQKVFALPARTLSPGAHNIRLDVSSLTSGVYFYTVSNGTETITHKLILR